MVEKDTMSPELMFRIGNAVAMAGWVSLLASPWFPLVARWSSAIAIPSLLALAYGGIMLTSVGDVEGSFLTLEGVMQLFTQPMVVVMGWLHYLAFDLFVGTWIAFDSRERGIRFAFVLPPLFLTLMGGPIGLLSYYLLLLVSGRFSARPAIP